MAVCYDRETLSSPSPTSPSVKAAWSVDDRTTVLYDGLGGADQWARWRKVDVGGRSPDAACSGR